MFNKVLVDRRTFACLCKCCDTHVPNTLGTPIPTAVQHRPNILGHLVFSDPPEYCHILTNRRHCSLTEPIWVCGSRYFLNFILPQVAQLNCRNLAHLEFWSKHVGIQHQRKPYLFSCLHTMAGGTWRLSLLVVWGQVYSVFLCPPTVLVTVKVEAYSTGTLKDSPSTIFLPLTKFVVDEWG